MLVVVFPARLVVKGVGGMLGMGLGADVGVCVCVGRGGGQVGLK